jgi:hypothetical protein
MSDDPFSAFTGDGAAAPEANDDFDFTASSPVDFDASSAAVEQDVGESESGVVEEGQSGFGLDALDAPADEGNAFGLDDAAEGNAFGLDTGDQKGNGLDDSVLREWEAEREKELAGRAAKTAEKKQRLQKQAEEDLAKFYQEREEKVSRQQKANREEEEENTRSMKQTIEGGSKWEKVEKLTSLKPAQGGKGAHPTERMRKLLQDLKNSPEQKSQE